MVLVTLYSMVVTPSNSVVSSIILSGFLVLVIFFPTFTYGSPFFPSDCFAPINISNIDPCPWVLMNCSPALIASSTFTVVSSANPVSKALPSSSVFLNPNVPLVVEVISHADASTICAPPASVDSLKYTGSRHPLI